MGWCRIIVDCHRKCVNATLHSAEADLTKGEAVCTDRCVNKFFLAMGKVT